MSNEQIERIIKTLEWLITDVVYRNELLDKLEESEELIDAKTLLWELKNGQIR